MINIIVACDRNRLIGRNGTLPWQIQKDWNYFLKTTKDGVLIMGRKCYEDFQDHVSSYDVIVVSRNHHHLGKVRGAMSFDEAIKLGRKSQKTIWICGGRAIYEESMAIADHLFLTRIDSEYKGDVYFPPWEKTFNRPMSSLKDHENGIDLEFLVIGKK